MDLVGSFFSTLCPSSYGNQLPKVGHGVVVLIFPHRYFSQYIAHMRSASSDFFLILLYVTNEQRTQRSSEPNRPQMMTFFFFLCNKRCEVSRVPQTSYFFFIFSTISL